MKKSSTGVISGCLVWILAFGVISACIVPIFSVVGSISSASNPAINFTGKFICPDGTTSESYSYSTTSRDENGVSHPATAYELHCVATNGEVLKSDPVGYAFLWTGIFIFIGIVLTAILAFALAAPAGVLISKLMNRMRKPNVAQNIEPQ